MATQKKQPERAEGIYHIETDGATPFMLSRSINETMVTMGFVRKWVLEELPCDEEWGGVTQADLDSCFCLWLEKLESVCEQLAVMECTRNSEREATRSAVK